MQTLKRRLFDSVVTSNTQEFSFRYKLNNNRNTPSQSCKPIRETASE